MYKKLSIVAVSALAITLAGCGQKQNQPSSNTAQAVQKNTKTAEQKQLHPVKLAAVDNTSNNLPETNSRQVPAASNNSQQSGSAPIVKRPDRAAPDANAQSEPQPLPLEPAPSSPSSSSGQAPVSKTPSQSAPQSGTKPAPKQLQPNGQASTPPAEGQSSNNPATTPAMPLQKQPQENSSNSTTNNNQQSVPQPYQPTDNNNDSNNTGNDSNNNQ